MSSSLGHAANATYPSPLCYVPFDINQPYSVPNVLAIKLDIGRSETSRTPA
ncbi:hypothetical protein C352_02111 [Cryptococcus neoformans CHC193]|nr:hypothetical protein C352_02111 [Cryptococcus neoformans var. grubii CHC193]